MEKIYRLQLSPIIQPYERFVVTAPLSDIIQIKISHFLVCLNATSSASESDSVCVVELARCPATEEDDEELDEERLLQCNEIRIRCEMKDGKLATPNRMCRQTPTFRRTGEQRILCRTKTPKFINVIES